MLNFNREQLILIFNYIKTPTNPQINEARKLGFFSQYQDSLICPACGGEVFFDNGSFRCLANRHQYHYESGIPIFLPPPEIFLAETTTKIIKDFYEHHPFPGYHGLESSPELRVKAKKNLFFALLEEQIPADTKVLEIGCGTGQLSNFLGLAGQRNILATDLSLPALKLGQEFKERNQVANTIFLQMDLFRPAFKDASFDMVICNGVLHHTSSPFLGFQIISRLVKKGGFVVLGLYNRYGRLPNRLKRLAFNLFPGYFKFLDPCLQDENLDAKQKNSWYLDQYKNPHESTHTIDEILSWFDRAGLEFINSLPKTVISEAFSQNESLFTPHQRGTTFDHFLVQLELLMNQNPKGGFFIMIGRKK